MSLIPSTGRKSRFQVKQMGYDSVVNFARSLPPNARVADIGAGFSKLGVDVTTIRNDVAWYNIDPCYIKHSLKDGVNYLAIDILSQTSQTGKMKGTFDLVYSYWLLPHLSLTDANPAKKAVINMASLLKSDGLLIVGPIKKPGLGLLSLARYKGTQKYQASEIKQVTIDRIVAGTRLWWLPRKVQLFSNRYNIHLAKFFVGGRAVKIGEQ